MRSGRVIEHWSFDFIVMPLIRTTNCVIGDRPHEHLKVGSTAQPRPLDRLFGIACQLPLPPIAPSSRSKQNAIRVPVLDAVPNRRRIATAVCARPAIERPLIGPFLRSAEEPI
jgi:hypothetical protein